MRKGGWLLGLVLGAVAAAVGSAYVVYRRQRASALRRLTAGSRMVRSHPGPIEAGSAGEGAAVLLVHGGGGGYDQGLLFARPEWGFRFLAPSRPGYLRTPLAAGRSPEEQADALAALLDAQHIERAAVIGMSAGGPSSLQFALRHPKRCWGLVLVSAIIQPIPPLPPIVRLLEKPLRRFDFLTWLSLRTPLIGLLLSRTDLAPLASRSEKGILLRQVLDTLFPISLRLPGTLNDLEWISRLPPWPFDRVRVPTLVIHGEADNLVPLGQARLPAEAIPGAWFLVIPGGGHLCFITHQEETLPVLQRFLRTHAPGK